MRVLIVTPSPTLKDGLSMVVAGYTDDEIATARDSSGARDWLRKGGFDLVLIDGCLPSSAVRLLIENARAAEPGARIAVLLNGNEGPASAEFSEAGAHLLPIYTRPPAEFFEALAQLVGQVRQQLRPAGDFA